MFRKSKILSGLALALSLCWSSASAFDAFVIEQIEARGLQRLDTGTVLTLSLIHISEPTRPY